LRSAGARQLDNPLGDDRLCRASIRKSKGGVSDLERHPHDARRLGIKYLPG